MARKTSLESANQVGAGGSYLPGLIGIAVALGIWMLAQPVVEEAQSLQQQIGISGRAKSLDSIDTVAELESQARQAAERRAAIEAQLQNIDPPAIAHAKILHDLRQACAAAGVQNCTVKYVDDVVQSGAQQPAAATAGDGSTASKLSNLGLSRSKAVISGQFQDLELTTLVNRLERQSSGVWRVNGLTVRNNRFELDAELITRPPQFAVSSRTPS